MTHRLFCLTCAAILMLPASTAWSATEDFHEVVRSKTGEVVLNSFGNCVRTRWLGANDACAAEAPPPRVEITREERTVYFDFDKFTLTQQAVAKLNSLADKMNSDSQIRQARIVGYADRIGTTTYNEQLSKRRAQNVLRYLKSRGFLKGHVADTRWLGESDSVTQCSDKLSRAELIDCLRKDRRVVVEIDYQTETPQ